MFLFLVFAFIRRINLFSSRVDVSKRKEEKRKKKNWEPGEREEGKQVETAAV